MNLGLPISPSTLYRIHHSLSILLNSWIANLEFYNLPIPLLSAVETYSLYQINYSIFRQFGKASNKWGELVKDGVEVAPP